MSDRFVLEEEILSLMDMEKDINQFIKLNEGRMNANSVEFLEGLKVIYGLRMQTLWNTFEEGVKEGWIGNKN